MKIYKVVPFLFFLFLGSSCAVKSTRFQGYIQERLKEIKPTTVSNTNVEIKISKDIKLSNQCKQVKSSYVPALFYWGWNSEVECEFSKETIENEMTVIAKRKADSLGMKGILDAKKLVIQLNTLPTRLKYQQKGDVIYLLVAYAYSEKRYIAPEVSYFQGKYSVEGKDEEVVLSNDFKLMSQLKMHAHGYKSTRKLSWQYIDGYNKELERIIVTLLQEIKGKTGS